MSDEQTQGAQTIDEPRNGRLDVLRTVEGDKHDAALAPKPGSRVIAAWATVRRHFVRRGETYWGAIFVAGLFFRAWQILFFRGPLDHVFSDPARHLDNARHFLEPGPMGCSNPYFYQLFLYVVIKLTKEQRTWTHLVNAALSVAYPCVWYGFARTVMKRRINAIRFATLLAFLPTHSVIFEYFMNETLILPLVGASLWASSAAARHRSAWRFILAAALWTCAVLTRSIAVPLGAFALGYALYHQPGRPLVRRPLLAIAAASIAAAGLWIAAQHSLRIFEYATPFGDNTTASIYMVSGAKTYQTTYYKPNKYSYTYIFSSPSFYVSPFDPFYEWHSVREGIFSYATNVETKGADLKKIYWDELLLHRRQLPRLVYENFIFLAFGHSWPESGKGDLVGRVCLQERWIWLPVTLIAVIGSLVFMIRRRKVYFVPALALFATSVLYGLQLVVMEGRYRKPIEPILFLAIFWLIEARRRPARGNFGLD